MAGRIPHSVLSLSAPHYALARGDNPAKKQSVTTPPRPGRQRRQPAGISNARIASTSSRPTIIIMAQRTRASGASSA